MKKTDCFIQFDTTPAPFRPLCPTDAAAGVLLLAGIWGLLWQCLRPESVPGLLGLGALAALGLAAGLLLRWDRKWRRGCPSAGFAGAVGGGHTAAEPHQRCSGGTGRLVGPVALSADRAVRRLCGGGSVWWICCLWGAVTGLAAGLVLRQRWRIWPAAACAAGLLALRLAGLVPGGWWFTCFLLGCCCALLQGSAIGRRAKASSRQERWRWCC